MTKDEEAPALVRIDLNVIRFAKLSQSKLITAVTSPVIHLRLVRLLALDPVGVVRLVVQNEDVLLSADLVPEHPVQECGVTNVVRFAGALPEKSKDELLRNSHLLLHTSQREGWGLNVIEANAMGTPGGGSGSR